VTQTLRSVQRSLDVVEAHLFEELPLASLTATAECSPWHFHRLFVALTGHTPAAYVRRRRLGEICRRLVETDEPLVDLALACGFESQAAFTRAFTRHVGVSPGRFRRARLFAPAHRYPPLDLAALVARLEGKPMEPRIVQRAAFHVVGIAGQFTTATNTRIPALWARFAPHMDGIPHRRGHRSLGVCLDATPETAEDPGFTYVADTVKQVWGRWLPASRYRHLPAPDFELYDERFHPETGDGEVDIYVPVADG
jgi:AraC family transcriptional regulator